MGEVGINIVGDRSMHMTEFLGELDFTYLIALGDEAHRVNFTGFPECVHWIVEDPASATGHNENRLHRFRQVREQISTCVHKWLAEAGAPVARRSSRASAGGALARRTGT